MLTSQKKAARVKILVLLSIIVLVSISSLVFISHSNSTHHYTGKGSYGLRQGIILSISLSILTILNAASALVYYLFPSRKIVNVLFNKITLFNMFICGIVISIITLLILFVGGIGFTGNLLDYLLYIPLIVNPYLFKIYINNKSSEPS
ncbi:MAG: hypothetical protein ACRYG7_08750 [Janthinobacterium lividum]